MLRTACWRSNTDRRSSGVRALRSRDGTCLARCASAPPGGAKPAFPGSSNTSPVLLLDVMDTIVHDPFFHEMPAFFNISFQDLLAAKHPSSWVDFECGRISEAQLAASFFADRRPVDLPRLRALMLSSYSYLHGMESLLQRLKSAGLQVRLGDNRRISSAAASRALPPLNCVCRSMLYPIILSGIRWQVCQPTWTFS
jgi:hypothetical protein